MWQLTVCSIFTNLLTNLQFNLKLIKQIFKEVILKISSCFKKKSDDKVGIRKLVIAPNLKKSAFELDILWKSFLVLFTHLHVFAGEVIT